MYMCPQGLKICQTVKSISLQNCAIGDEGCEMLCQAMKDIRNIVNIDMSNCGLSHKGAQSVADLIKVSIKLLYDTLSAIVDA